MSLPEYHRAAGAALAADGIPLHYGDHKAEYTAALEQAVLMDRSHEGRIEASGRDRLSLIHRISTNDILNLPLNHAQATIFTNPQGRILDRALVCNRGETALMLTEPGRGGTLTNYLQRKIFFGDEVSFTETTAATRLLALHGPQADAVVDKIVPGASAGDTACVEAVVAGVPTFIVRRKPVSGAHWALLAPNEAAEIVWQAVLETGSAFGLTPAGSLTFNALRIRAGRPAVGRELSTDYIPLEAGLWDEVSFTKGCYTGQEIIARMESRNRLAKTLVTLRLAGWVEAPANLHFEDKVVGTLTSSVITPTGEVIAMGFVKLPLAVPGHELIAGENRIQAAISALAGAQPPQRIER